MTTSGNADCLSQQSRQKIQQTLQGGDGSDAIYLHRENAIRYYARAMAAMPPPSSLN